MKRPNNADQLFDCGFFRQVSLGALCLGLLLGSCDCGDEPTVPVKESCKRHSDCPRGQECDPEQKVCVAAFTGYCDTDEDCVFYGDDLYCEAQVHVCVSLHECDENSDCPDEGMECQTSADTGYRVCVFPGCSDDTECEIELAGTCEAGTRARCVLRECICQDACGGPCGDGRLCCGNQDPAQCVEDPGHCTDSTCEPGYAGQTDVEAPWSVDDCNYVGDQCSCQELPHLPWGDIGDPSDLALRADGTPVLAAYAFGFDHDPNYPDTRYGDLMLGQANASGQLSWTFIDGMPASPIVAGPTGPRSGVLDPGDNVGRELDLVLDDQGRAHIAYLDQSAHALRYARVELDGSVVVVEVDSEGDTGHAPSITLDPGNQAPRISYFTRRVDLQPDGAEARLRVAVAAVAEPSTPANFALHTAAAFDLTTLPCEIDCPDGEVCQDLPDPQIDICVPEDNTCASCGTAQACVSGHCVDIIEAPLSELPAQGIGTFSSIEVRPGGELLVLAHDSVAGDLALLTPASGANILQSGATFDMLRLDGVEPSSAPARVGSHIDSALASGGNIHLSYLDDSSGALIYARLDASNTLLDRTRLDDAQRPGPMGARDLHVLADPAISVAADGRRSVVYQDATVQALWRCDAAPGHPFNGCTWVAGGLPGGAFDGAYGFSTSAAFDEGSGALVFSTYRFVPVLDAPYQNGVVLFGHPALSDCIDDTYEDNDSAQTAVAYPGAPTPGRICAGDVDWFVLDVAAGQRVVVQLGFDHSLGDLDLRLYDSSDQQLAASVTLTDDEQISYNATAADRLAVKINGFSGASNSYVLAFDAR